jgi:hypothetical protein
MAEDEVEREIQSLYKEATLAERHLKEFEAHQHARDAEEGRGIRAQLAFLYESMMLASIDFAENNAIDERLWTRVLYPQIEALRGHLRRAQEENASPEPSDATSELTERVNLLVMLDQAEALYTALIMELRLKEGLDFDGLAAVGVKRLIEGETGVPGQAENILATIQRQLIHLGDIARYRALATESPKAAKDYSVAAALYERGLLLGPISGRAQSQISLLTTYDEDPLASAYWTCLSMSSSHPHALARNNLRTIFQRQSAKLDALAEESLEASSSGAMDIDLPGPEMIASARILRVIRQSIFHDVLPGEDLRPMYDAVKESLPALIKNSGPNRVRRLAICLMVGYEELHAKFRAAQLVPAKQAVREQQSLLVCIIFDLLAASCSAAAEQLATSAWSALDGEDEGDGPKLATLESLALVPWLSKHLENAIRISNEYSGWYGEGIIAVEFQRQRIGACARALADLANAALDAYVLEKTECLEEDLDLFGAVPCRAFFTQLDKEQILGAILSSKPGSRVAGASTASTEQLLSRALVLARSFVERELLGFDEATGSYIVLGSRDRKKQGKPLKLIRPEPRQTEESETQETLPHAVIGPDILLDHPEKVRAWIELAACECVVPAGAWDSLERSDRPAVSSLLAHADQRSFRKQRNGEQAPLEDALALAGISEIPPQHRPVLSLCLYLFGEPGGFDPDPEAKGALVTDDAQLLRLAGACGIPALSPKQMDAWTKRTRRMSDLVGRTRTLGSKNPGGQLRR